MQSARGTWRYLVLNRSTSEPVHSAANAPTMQTTANATSIILLFSISEFFFSRSTERNGTDILLTSHIQLNTFFLFFFFPLLVISPNIFITLGTIKGLSGTVSPSLRSTFVVSVYEHADSSLFTEGFTHILNSR